jgi:lipopolysaccharide transport system ATP-binding protein
VSFSEIEKFIDTPVKWYSSGMYVRLAFSVAAHLEPEVLIMDEVLAVGDAAFQQKCLDKMRDIRRQGRTIFFVSHNMPAVTRLCKRVILLDKGSIISDGPAQKIVGDYLSASWNVAAEREWNDAQAAPGNEIVRLRRVRVRTESGDTTASIEISNPVGIEMVYEVLRSGHVLTPHIDFFNEDGAHLFAVEDVSQKWRRTPREAGLYTSVMWLPGNYLAEGNVLVCASIITRFPVAAIHVDERNVAAFQVIDNLQGGTARGDRVGTVPGIVRPLLNWTTHYHVSDV